MELAGSKTVLTVFDFYINHIGLRVEEAMVALAP